VARGCAQTEQGAHAFDIIVAAVAEVMIDSRFDPSPVQADSGSPYHSGQSGPLEPDHFCDKGRCAARC
jgi:hypothetical protein